MKNGQKGIAAMLVIALVALLAISGGVYIYSQKKAVSGAPEKTQTPSTASGAFNDSDLRISLVPAPLPDNSAPAFNAVKQNSFSQTDVAFLSKYVSNYSSTNLPPVAQSQKIIAAHLDLLKIFDANAHKPYQCLMGAGQTCLLLPIRNSAQLAGLRALVSYQQNKMTQAEASASDIVSLGKNVSANARDGITLVLGWSVQKLGYGILATVHAKGSKVSASLSEKTTLAAKLRAEHKTVLRYEYSQVLEEIDYITSQSNKPVRQLSPDEEDVISAYRKSAAASPTAWNPSETKKYFYDSYKIEVANVDLPCGATPVPSKIDLKYDAQDQQTENVVGKTLYQSYAPINSLGQKRCEIESLLMAN